MEHEKEKEFKVTDKRSTFRQDSEEHEKSETSAESATPTETAEQPREKQEQVPPLPEANLLTLILSLYTHVQICLGIVPDPVTQTVRKDLQQAKYNIDLLGVLKEKTKGNLSEEEEQALESILYEVRMTYVGASK